MPVRLNREIYGHIGNRLATALWREAVHLLAEGVATAAEIDRAVVEGPGRKWALTGPFESYALSGGDGGIRRFLEPFSPGIQRRWDDLGTPQLDAETRALIATSVESALTGTSGRQRQRERARRLVALSRLLDSGDRES
ncbi:3-hydroxyacyl-CoA dehydrogenase family protein [Tropicimonas isoalkanivorans]|uniref:3-hydroxyacyl-CoA dehydrogenase family protein n=1 Tax=Tropicimonas isoalkanivorans TaxID=441112 RepID=UPI0024820896|nr:3-hydroxyacyl-CoA dehydrogenase family protein [Tropicimonas isoalkanivorans]